jgi:hypothetical protein
MGAEHGDTPLFLDAESALCLAAQLCATAFSPRPRTLLTIYYTTLGAGGASRLAPWARKGLVSQNSKARSFATYRPEGAPRASHAR